MSKVTFIGGGSAKFVRELVVDLFAFEELRDSHICLMDIDAERLARSEQIVRKMIMDRKLPARVETTTDQRRALAGADYVVITIMVGGFDAYGADTAIPSKYGVHQAVSDTTGPGGVFRIVRTSPVLQQIAKNLKEVAPQAWILNYANPMSMNTWTLLECGHARTVGLCHSIQGCYVGIAKSLGIPPEEVNYTAAGINHINFYLTLERQGQDIYPLFRANADRLIQESPTERPRFELLKYLGYFPAEGPHHQSEYYAWFRKNQAAIDHYHVETAWGYNFDKKYNGIKMADVDRQIAGTDPIDYTPSVEYGAKIIHSLKTGTLRLFYGNVWNSGLIENLPARSVVEVPCVVDRNGILPVKMGRIPPQLAAGMTPHIALHELAVAGALQKDRRLIRLAVQADPLTGAILTLPQITELVDEMFAANQAYVQDWA
jgi:alpha-galactosidase